MEATKIKVLICIDWFLPGTNSGGPVRSYANLIAHLKEDFEFFIVTRNTDFGSNQPYANITPNTWTVFNSYTKVYYLSKENINKGALKALFKNTEFDVAYINGIYSWYFSILPILLIKKRNKPILVSARGMLNPQAFSVKRTKKKLFLKLARVFNLYKGITFHATNRDEAQHIKSIIGKKTNIQIAPNLPRKLQATYQAEKVKHQPVRFINVARVSIEKGTLTMLKALKQLDTPLVLDMFGPIYDKAYWAKCEAVIAQLPKHIKVNYKGVLASEAIPETLAKYDFFVLLSEGENFGHAILEAFSAGLPVLISNKTPWKDLESKSIGWDVNLKSEADILRGLKEAIKMNNTEYALWSTAAFQFAKTFTENPELIEQNKALFFDNY